MASRRSSRTYPTVLMIPHVLLLFLFTLLLSEPATGKKDPREGNVEDPLRLKTSVPITESATYAAGLYYAPHVADASVPVPFCHPRHVHLSVGATPWNSMTVSFSLPRDCPPETVRISLDYGRLRDDDDDDDDDDADTAYEHSTVVDYETHGTRYEYTSTKHQLDRYESDHLFHVPLSGLEPDRTYAYRISVRELDDDDDNVVRTWADVGGIRNNRGNDTDNDSVVAPSSSSSTDSVSTGTAAPPDRRSTFRTIPAPEARVGTRMAVVADLGQTYNSSVTMAHMFRETTRRNDDGRKPVSVVLCGGDCSYSDSNAHRWDSWFDLAEPLLSRTPFQVVAGNHEIECDGETFDVFTSYEHRFRMPSERRGRRPRNKELCLVENARGRYPDTPSAAIYHYDYGNSFYSFTHGITRVIVLNCYTYSRKDSRQYKWLVEEFASIDRDVTPWVMIMVHCPLYNTFYDHHNEFNTRSVRNAMEKLFYEHRVNLVVSGHSHGYLRTTGAYRDRVDPAGPVYLIVGEGGNHENHSPGYRFPDRPEEWVVKRDNTEYGFATLDFLNASVARWTWIRNFDRDDDDDDDGREFTDDVFLENQWLSGVEGGKVGENLEENW